jgi:hypothetical protein
MGRVARGKAGICGIPHRWRPTTAASQRELILSCRTVLNGTVLNGTVLNGTVLNGTVLNGTVLNGTVLNGTVLMWTE